MSSKTSAFSTQSPNQSTLYKAIEKAQEKPAKEKLLKTGNNLKPRKRPVDDLNQSCICYFLVKI